MAPKLGYLLPTRERIMEGKHEVAPMLAAAEKAEALGYDSVWIGDSVLARPRHEPISLLRRGRRTDQKGGTGGRPFCCRHCATR